MENEVRYVRAAAGKAFNVAHHNQRARAITGTKCWDILVSKY